VSALRSLSLGDVGRRWRQLSAGDRKYLIASAGIFVVMLSHVVKSKWGGGIDIWEHAAAVRELRDHPLHPDHPLFAIHKPHQFFSPYHLGVALFSRLPGLGVVNALNVMAMFNLVLLLVGLRLFVGRISQHRDTPFYALIFILFLWGPMAWFFSGFVHFAVLPLLLSYPSTFAKGVVLLCLWAHTIYIERRQTMWLVPSLVGSVIVLLSHPVDAIFLFVGLIALAVVAVKDWRQDAGLLLDTGGVIVFAFIGAFLWPYFSLNELLWGKANEGYRKAIDAAEQDMYVKVLQRALPALVALPFILRRAIVARLDALTVMFGALLVLYGYGWLSERHAYGRLISALVIVALIILADERAAATTAARRIGAPGIPLMRWAQVSTAALVLFGAYQVRNGLIALPDTIVKHFPYGWVHSEVDLVHTTDLAFIPRFATRKDVILSDLYTSLEIPAFGPRVVGVARAEAFVDTSEAGAALNRYFEQSTRRSDREAIIRKYSVDFVMLTQERLVNDPTTYRPLRAIGTEVYANARFVLLDVRDIEHSSP
jgi:hypothetical protein